MDDIARIAAGLSVAQRRAVLNGESPKGYARSRLLSAGIFQYQSIEGSMFNKFSLTPLGQSVAQYLRSQGNGN